MRATASRSARIAPLLVLPLLFAASACTADDGGTDPTTTVSVTPSETVTTAESASSTTTESVTVEVTTTADLTPVPATTTPLASAPDCEADAFRGDFSEPVVMFCDGEWARAGQAFTDHLIVYRATEGNWVHYEPHGRSAVTDYPCFDEDTLVADGVPDELRASLSLCQD